nr:MAG: hypothetical protein [Bacteriophage sp.]
MIEKIIMETCGGEYRAYPEEDCVYVLGEAELTEEESEMLTDAEEDESERNIKIPLKIGYDETEVTLEFYKIIAAATVSVSCDSVEVYGELYHPSRAEIMETVGKLPYRVYMELFGGLAEAEVEEAVVQAGLYEAVDSRCAHILEAALKKACKAAGLPWEKLEFQPFAIWED